MWLLLGYLADEMIHNRHLEPVGIAAVAAVALALAVVVTHFARVRLGWRGFLPGVLIAFGITLLLGGYFVLMLLWLSR